MIKTIYFDFGNVLGFFDHQRAIRRLQPYTHLTAVQMVQAMYGGELEYRYECGQATTDDVYAQARVLGRVTCSRAEFIESFCDIFSPNPPMSDLIPRLKQNGYRLVVASNTNEAHYERYREQFRDLLAHFDAIAVSHEAGVRKPSRAFFEYAQRFADGRPEECAFVDDVAENVTGASEYGWQAIHFTTFDALVAELRRVGVNVS